MASYTENDMNEFKKLVGESIMYFQTIEHDLRIIYAAMKIGDMYETLKNIDTERWTLGNTVHELEKLDLSDGTAYISINDYKFLKTLTGKRNHIVHKMYESFLYEGDSYKRTRLFTEQFKDLKEYVDRMKQVYKVIENIRLKALKDFRRI